LAGGEREGGEEGREGRKVKCLSFISTPCTKNFTTVLCRFSWLIKGGREGGRGREVNEYRSCILTPGHPSILPSLPPSLLDLKVCVRLPFVLDNVIGPF